MSLSDNTVQQARAMKIKTRWILKYFKISVDATMLDVAQFSIEFLFILKRPLLSSSATSRFSAIAFATVSL